MTEKSINSSDTVLSALQIAYKPESEQHEVEDKKDNPGSVIDFYFALGLLIISYLTIHFVDLSNIDWIHTTCMIGNLCISFAYVKYRGFKLKKYDVFLFVFMLVACIPNILFTNNLLKLCNILFIHMLQMYWLLKCCGHLSEEKESDWILYDGFASIFLVPLTCLRKSLSFLTRFSLKRIRLKNLFMIFVGFIISIPLLIIVLSQLFIAEDTFFTLFTNAFQNMDSVVKTFITFMLSIPLFLYYYSATFGNVACQPNTKGVKKKLEFILQKVAKVPSTILVTMEVLLCVVYLLFIGSCLYSIYMHVFSTAEFAYAQYARDGFFELCRITVLNLFVLSFIEIVIEKGFGKLHIFVKRMLCFETVCIIMTALYRMYLYIDAYGFTYKRIYATWLMIVLFGAFVMIFFYTFKKGKVILSITRYAAICFLILNFINVDNLVRRTYDTSIVSHPKTYDVVDIEDVK